MKHLPLLMFCAIAWVCAAIMDHPTMPVDSCVMVYNETGGGSGAIVDVNCVLTAKHVAINPDLKIRTNDGDEHRVARVVLDPDSDLARLYIDGKFDEQPLSLDPTPLRVGDEVSVIGMVLRPDLMNCVLPGHVVKVNYEIQVGNTRYVNLDVCDYHAAPGCSGGPVVDRRGRVRGVQVIGIGPLSSGVPVEELNVQ